MIDNFEFYNQFTHLHPVSPKAISERIEFVKATLFDQIDAAARDEALSARIKAQFSPLVIELETLNFHLGALLAPSFASDDTPEK